MKLHRSKQEKLQAQGLTLAEAHGIVWEAGNMALGKASTEFEGTYDVDRYNQQVAEHIGKLFTKLDQIREESSVLSRAILGSAEPRIDPGDLLFDLPFDQDRPFIPEDESTMAARSLDLLVGAAYTELIDQKLWNRFTPQEKAF